ncbi:hypothetical protein RHSA111115_15440 [Rheinheimera salexigens]
MTNILSILFVLISFTLSASENPCDVIDYPIKNSREIYHPSSFPLPAIYYNKNDVSVIVPVKLAIELTKEGLDEANDVLKITKNQILNSLESIKPGELINSDSLWSWPQNLPREKYQVATQTIVGYQAIYEKSLLRNLATVKIDEALINSSYFKYMNGRMLSDIDEHVQVHKVIIISNQKTIYERCWIDE